MRRPDVFWHIYANDQIKAALRGHLVYVLEIPPVPGSPVIRDIFDPTGQDFQAESLARAAHFVNSRSHGIIYRGVSKSAVYDLISFDPPVSGDDPQFTMYNRKVIANSRSFFLSNPNLGFEMMPVNTLRLVCGSAMNQRATIGS